MKPTLLLTLVCGLALAMPAAAQWQWTDGSGKKVFSDSPPPPDIPERNILQRPHGRAAPAAPAPAASAASKPGEALPKAIGVDKELEEKRRQAEAAEAAKRKAQEQEQAKARADNCARARQGKAQYDSGSRIVRMNEKGEREFLDDATRAAETRRLQDLIQSECR